MARKNQKQQVISYENSIQKSNKFSMAKLSHKLTLNQMQLLAYAIFSTQKNGKTEFIKADFEKQFELGEYRREEAKEDSRKLFELEFSLDDLENDEFDFLHVFQRINYKDGLFTFKWSEDMIPHILDLQDHYITNGFLTVVNFKSGFSWILYDYIKAHFKHWYISISKESLMKLFNVDKVKTYQKNTGEFKRGVLDVAIAEINQYTELEVSYEEIKKGRSIIGFNLKWSNGTVKKGATKKQIEELKLTVDTVLEDVFRYVDIDIKERRQRAIQIIEIVRGMKQYTKEPISITSEFASEQIEKAKAYLQELNDLLTVKSKRDTSFYYNWLEGDGNV